MRTWGLGCACGMFALGSRRAVNAWQERHQCPDEGTTSEYRDVSGSLVENAEIGAIDLMRTPAGFRAKGGAA